MLPIRSSFTLVVCLLGGFAAVESVQAQSIPLARADVDRDCTVTRVDATIVQGQLGKRTGQAGFNPNADVDQNGLVNVVDVTFVTRNVGKNVCAPPPAAPTIAASIAPAANGFGWHNTPVTVTFTCTNAVSCPGPVTVSTEGAAQVVTRTAANAAGATASASVTLNLDFTPPVLGVTAPSVLSPGASVAIPVSATDLSGLATSSLLVQRAVVATRTAAPFDLTYAVPPTAAIGFASAFEVVGEDRAGNVRAVRLPFTVETPDTQGPVVSIGAPAVAAPGATVPLTVRAADDRGDPARVRVSRVESAGNVVIDDRTAGPFAFQAIGQIPAAAADGSTVTFLATTTDLAGNTSAATADVRVLSSVATPTLRVTVDPPLSPTFQVDGVITGTIGVASAAAPPPAPPIIAALSPASGGQGQNVDLTITGVNTTFGPLTQVALGTGVTVQSVTAASPTSIVARVAIAATAPAGPRLVAVSTGREQAVLADAFSVVAGVGRVNGRILSAPAQPIQGAQICQPSGGGCATSAADGTFSALGVPVDARRLVISAAGFETASVGVALSPNGTSSVGDVVLTAVNLPPPPPLPNSPPIAPALAIVLGKGATALDPGLSLDQARLLVRDTIIAVGGREIGVLDAGGQQLNPKMTGTGYASYTEDAVEDIAKELIFGNTMTVAELLTILANSVTLPPPSPTLSQLLAALQSRIDAAWQNPSSPDAALVMLLFNRGRVASAAPPRLTFDMELNALQTNLMTMSFLVFVTRHLPEGAAPPYAALPERRLDSPGWIARAARGLASLVPWPAGPRGFASQTSLPGRFAPAWPALVRARQPLRQSSGGNVVADRAASVMWQTAYQQVLGQTGWDTAKKLGKVCDGFLVSVATGTGEAIYGSGTPEAAKAIQDPYAKILPQPDCKTVVDLLSIVAQSGEKSYASAAKSMKGYYAGIAATRDMGKVVETYYSSKSQQDAWKAVKAEARQQHIQAGLANLGKGLVEGVLSKVQGLVVDKVLELEANLVIESVRPRKPFVTKVEQVEDPSVSPPRPSAVVRVTFTRSPNDKVTYDSPSIVWRYRLYRGQANRYIPVAGKIFTATEPLELYDEVPQDGTYSYVVVGVRQVGAAIDDPPPPNKMLAFLGGFFDSTLRVGAEGAKRAVFGIGILDYFKTPTLQIIKGIRYQVSDASDPGLIYVNTTTPAPKPPATLAVWGATGITFVNVPSLDRIFAVTNGTTTVVAQPNFKAPGAIGLGISGNGTLYTDNSASDAQFGGRVFSFNPLNGARTLAGTVNYFSQLLMFANPVAVQAMTVASGPFGSNLTTVHEESLFIADAQNQRITRMTLPSSLPANYPFNRNVSQPWVSSPLFNFGPDTAMAMSSNYRMAITQGNDILFASPAGPFAPPAGVDTLFGSGAPSPYARLSGVTFDGYTNLYVSDLVQGTLSMIPAERSAPNNGLFGLSAVDRKKLVVTSGLLRPVGVTLASQRDGLVFYDAERIHGEVKFGMSGQVRDDNGVPLAGATLHVPALRRAVKTDTDGVFVMPDLVRLGASPVIDFTVEHQGQTRTFSQVLDIFKHNVVDITFPPAPPLPSDPPTAPVLPPPPPPAVRPKADPSVSVAVEFDLDPSAPPPPAIAPGSCPRGVILSPAMGVATTQASVTVNGMVSNRWAFGTAAVPDGFLVVNGVATPLTLSGLEFSITATLNQGDNVIAFALPARVLKPIGCAPASAADTDPIVVSTDHRVYHHPSQSDVDALRSQAGWDLAARAIVRTGGIPLAGLDFIVPGTGISATTDGDGVAQLNLSKTSLSANVTSADQLATGLSTEIAQAVAYMRADQSAPAIAALDSLFATAVGAANAPLSAAKNAPTLASHLTRLQGIVSTLLDTLRALQVPSPLDIATLEALAPSFAGSSSGGEIVIRASDYPNLTITVKVQ